MIEDVGEADTDSKDQGVTGGLVMAMKDMKVWLMMFVLCAYVVGLSFNAFFVSTTITQPRLQGNSLTCATANTHRNSWIRLRSNAPDEQPSLVVLLHCISDQCSPFGSYRREVLAHCGPNCWRLDWLHHLHVHSERRRPLRCPLPPGKLIRRVSLHWCTTLCGPNND